MSYLGNFVLEFETTIVIFPTIFVIFHLEICLITKFREKKIPTFRTKNALLWYFWAKILKSDFHI